jgi:hypothetical protein
MDKRCSKCNETKPNNLFIKNRNICKSCNNIRRKELYDIVTIKTSNVCNICDKTKDIVLFIRNRNICRDCNNDKRKKEYNENEDTRKRIIKGRYISKVKRLKTNPVFKFICNQRSRIYNALRNKQKTTIEYLGCNSTEFFNWLSYNFDENINFENYGSYWHIDHVIPISNFNLENVAEQTICFNWRNTCPLSVKENLTKNNSLVSLQIEQHYKKLLLYHKEKNIKMPQEIIDLFAKHLVDGNLLKQSLPPHIGNIMGELG